MTTQTQTKIESCDYFFKDTTIEGCKICKFFDICIQKNIFLKDMKQKMKCPCCGKILRYIEDADEENYVCKHCNLKWLIVDMGD